MCECARGLLTIASAYLRVVVPSVPPNSCVTDAPISSSESRPPARSRSSARRSRVRSPRTLRPRSSSARSGAPSADTRHDGGIAHAGCMQPPVCSSPVSHRSRGARPYASNGRHAAPSCAPPGPGIGSRCGRSSGPAASGAAVRSGARPPPLLDGAPPSTSAAWRAPSPRPKSSVRPRERSAPLCSPHPRVSRGRSNPLPEAREWMQAACGGGAVAVAVHCSHSIAQTSNGGVNCPVVPVV
eukprot:6967583-Prymnesium_polylepis.1